MSTRTHDPVSSPVNHEMPPLNPPRMAHPQLRVVAYVMLMLLVAGGGVAWMLARLDTAVSDRSVADDTRAPTPVVTRRLLHDDAQVDGANVAGAALGSQAPAPGAPGAAPALAALPALSMRVPVPPAVLAASAGEPPLPSWPAQGGAIAIASLHADAGTNPAPAPVGPSAMQSHTSPLMVGGQDASELGVALRPEPLHGRSEHEIGAQLTGDERPAASATQLTHRAMLLAEGAQIGCVLQTRLDSTLPGLVSCLVTDNVYSDTGENVLIERGSLATGEYRSAVAPGQKRIFVVWQRIKTPNGVVVRLDSPATDALGGSGIPMDVDAHWFSRIGAAFLLSIVEDGLVAATAPRGTSNQSATSTFSNTTQTTQSLSEKVLESTINQPPTLTRDEGQRINIMVARDLYFDKVYGKSR